MNDQSRVQADDDLLIGYLLQELDAEGQSVVLRRLEAEPELAGRLRSYEALLLSLADRVEPVALSAEFRLALEERLHSAQPIERPGQQPARKSGRGPGFWSLIQPIWPWAGPSAGFALGLSVAVLLLPGPDAVSLRAQQQAQLLSEARLLAALTPLPSGGLAPAGPSMSSPVVARWVVEQLSDGSLLIRPVRPLGASAGRVLQVWTKAPDAERPTSLGLARADGSLRVLPEQARQAGAVEGQLFELTEEPAGGSPTGLPTGPVLAIGRVM